MDIRVIKSNARKTLKYHLFISILVCFIVTLIVSSGYKFNTSINFTSDDQVTSTVTKAFYDTSNINTIDDFIKRTETYNKLVETVDYKPTRGFLSVFVNQIDGTGSMIIGTLNASNQMFFKNTIPTLITQFIGMILYIFSIIFIQNIFIVGKNRYFLEHRKYQDTPFDKITFIYKIKMTKNTAKIMFKRTILTALWWITIIGGIIKHYEYSMIPYILAENPKVNSKDCFKLSKQMTYGYKMAMFKIDLSLILWYILGFLTLGLSNIFYFNPYKESIYSEIYMTLREKNIEGHKRIFKDKYLEGENIEGEYPFDKYFIEEVNHKKWIKMDYQINYDIQNIILFFFTFSIVGYLWEVSIHLFNEGIFVNRGTMFGPWLPIYGFGGLVIIIFLQKLKSKPVYLFTAAFIISAIIEYFTAWYLETTKGMKWWDYSGYFLNIQGRICLEGLLVFALASSAFTYFVVPNLNNLFNKIKPQIKICIITILLTFFISDMIYSHYVPNSGEGITTIIEKNV